ncbi:MAG: acetolactate synthase small subunit, partial [Candidatus Microthrix sp.]|nr:acetolactate synthase small subunit [Candidatus Microthrix sp.]
DPRESVERELMLVTVKAKSDRRREVIELTQVFNGRILDVGHHAITVALDARPDRLDTFEQLLLPYGVASLQRTGRVALPKIDNRNG